MQALTCGQPPMLALRNTVRNEEPHCSILRVGSIVLRVDDLRRQTEFWTAALDNAPREDPSDDFALLRPKDGKGPNLSLDRHRSELDIPPRFHPRLVYRGSRQRSKEADFGSAYRRQDLREPPA